MAKSPNSEKSSNPVEQPAMTPEQPQSNPEITSETATPTEAVNVIPPQPPLDAVAKDAEPNPVGVATGNVFPKAQREVVGQRAPATVTVLTPPEEMISVKRSEWEELMKLKFAQEEIKK